MALNHTQQPSIASFWAVGIERAMMSWDISLLYADLCAALSTSFPTYDALKVTVEIDVPPYAKQDFQKSQF